MRVARLLLPSLAALGCLLASGDALAASPVKVGIGPIIGFGGNFLDKPDDKTYPLPDGTRTEKVTPSYPGFGGTTFAYGLAFDLQLKVPGVLLAIEMDWMPSQTNKGKADLDLYSNGVKAQTINVEIEHTATHLPVMIKGGLDSPLFSPYLLVGAEFVRASDAKATVTPASNSSTFGAKTDNYTYLLAGLGFQIKLPIPGIDIRIPFSLRASIHTGDTEKLEDRATYDFKANTITYDTRWKYQALATLGAQIYFF